MSTQQEFPYLTDEAIAAYRAAFPDAVDPFVDQHHRRYLSAFLREAMNQAIGVRGRFSIWKELEAIADNLHSSPPPPPPTLAQAREANLDTAEGKATVSAFLETLGEGVQS